MAWGILYTAWGVVGLLSAREYFLGDRKDAAYAFSTRERFLRSASLSGALLVAIGHREGILGDSALYAFAVLIVCAIVAHMVDVRRTRSRPRA